MAWMVLEPSIADYGTRLGSSLYSAVVRLDNLGRCFDFGADAGNREVCPNARAIARQEFRVRMTARGVRL
jgi:hypothetical protein